MLSRRQVMAALAAVPAAGALAAGVTALRWWDRPPGEGLAALSQDEHEFLVAVADAWMPPGGEPAISGSETGVADFLDGVVASMAPAAARELKLLFQALDDLPAPLRLAPFRKLPLEARIEVLQGWIHHDQWLLRNAALAVLVLVAESVAMHPDYAAILQPHFRCGYGA